MAKVQKYRNKKVTVNGIEFDSKKEAKRYCELLQLEKEGAITNLRMQVKYILIPKQYSETEFTKAGKHRLIEHECSYIADFVYDVPITIEREMKYRNGPTERVLVHCGYETVVEDTKGMRTKDYIIKRKLMLYVHGIRIKEI